MVYPTQGIWRAGQGCLPRCALIAARRLATELVRRGQSLRAGDVVLAGALGPTVTAAPCSRRRMPHN